MSLADAEKRAKELSFQVKMLADVAGSPGDLLLLLLLPPPPLLLLLQARCRGLKGPAASSLCLPL